MTDKTTLQKVFNLSSPVSYVKNESAVFENPTGSFQDVVIGVKGRDAAFTEISKWPGYQATPLRRLSGLAQAVGVKSIAYKDESNRFGLGSFKALGGAYAVLCVLQEKLAELGLGSNISTEKILAGTFKEQISAMTVCSATDGNHGRAVAWGAQRFGCRCVIYVHERVSQGRIDAIAAYGADVRVVPGNYDDAVKEAARVSDGEGWTVVSDTSYEGYVTIPRNVIKGYTVMVSEAITQHEKDFGCPPTHVFIQGGVGALAGAVASSFWEHYGAKRPRYCVVEPDRAACLFESARAGKPVTVTGDLNTMMAGLACGEVSLIAWDILQYAADDFLSITDQSAIETMRVLASDVFDTPFVAGESAVAGVAGCILASQNPGLAQKLGLDENSRVLFFGTEGATDLILYKEIIGRSAEEVEGTA